MLWGPVLGIAWIVVAGLFATLIVVSFLTGYRLRRLLRCYGSIVAPGIKDFAGITTPVAQIKIQRYVFSKAYREETREELRLAGQRQRQIYIIGLILAALFFALSALVVLLPGS